MEILIICVFCVACGAVLGWTTRGMIDDPNGTDARMPEPGPTGTDRPGGGDHGDGW